uniref:Uncharacterized protein n=1 Tax=uncultured Elusimicrobia bacterium TaxID=699876 RepID=A0A650EMJ1_9BACT|nr:hypothetical protein Elusimicrob1349_1220 [uncultured Elusimicrobia bacterium]
MATTKQITELNPASALAASDKLAVAQAGAAEAKSATVSQVAQAVAALNEEGALAELTLATSLGKNLLAQRLTEKGVPTAPSETLAQMADKVGGLVVEDSVEVLKGPVGYKYQSVTVQSPYNNFAFKTLSNGDKILWADNKLHYIPDGDYDTFDQFLNAATAVVPCTWNKNGQLKFDKKQQYAAVASANDSVNVYKIDAEEKTVSLYKPVALEYALDSSAYYGGFGLNITSGGRFITYLIKDPENSSYGKMAAVNVQTGETVLSAQINKSHSYIMDFCELLETDDSSGVICGSYQSYTWGVRLYYQIADGAWTWEGCFDTAQMTNLLPLREAGKLFKVTQLENSANLNFVTVRLYVYNPDMTLFGSADIPVVPKKYNSYMNAGLCLNSAVRVWEDDGKFKIELLPFLPAFTLDPAAKQVTWDASLKYMPAVEQTMFSGSSSSSYVFYLFGNKTTGTYTGYYNSNRVDGVLNQSQLCKIYITKDEKATGFRRTAPGGKTFVYAISAYTEEDVLGGAMDAETTALPLPGAEEEEA